MANGGSLFDSVGTTSKGSSSSKGGTLFNSLGAPAAQTSEKSSGGGGFLSNLVSHIPVPARNATSEVLHVASRPQQAIMQGLQQVISGNSGNALSAAKNAFLGKTPDINSRQELGLDKNSGGRVSGFFDTVLGAIQDPLSYVGGVGIGSKVAKEGLGVIEREGGKELADQVAARGLKNLAPEKVSQVRDILSKSPEAANAGDKYVTRLAGKPNEFASAGKLVQPQGLKLGGVTVLKNSTAKGLADAAGITKAGKAVSDSDLGNLLKNTFANRQGIKTALGKGAAESFRQADVTAKGTSDVFKNDINNILRAAVRKGTVTNEERSTIQDALEKGTQRAADAKFKADGSTTARRLLRAADKAQKEVQSKAASLANEGQQTLGNLGSAYSRTISPEFREFAQKNPELAQERFGVSLDRTGNPVDTGKLAREYPLHSATDINKELGQKVYEETPEKSISEQAKVVTKDLYNKSLADELVKTPEKLAIKDSGQAIPKGYERVTLGNAGSYFMPHAVAQEYHKFANLLTNDQALKTWGKLVNKLNGLWKTQATSSLIFGVPFQAHNGGGNLLMMLRQGFNDPRMLSDAAKLRSKYLQLQKKGMTTQEILRSKELTADQKKILAPALKKEVLQGGFTRTELGTDKIAATKKEKILEALNPASSRNLITGAKPGAELSRWVEDVPRLAMFQYGLKKFGSVDAAERLVKETFFDYGDLTHAEKKIKNLIPFYTFLKKNTALQTRMFLSNPGLQQAQNSFKNNVFQDPNGQEIPLSSIPDYLQDNGAVNIGSVGGNPILASFPTPFQAATQNFQPLVDALQGNGSKAAAGLLTSSVGGVPAGLARAMAEQATGKKLYNGAPNSNPAQEYLQALSPLASRVLSVKKASGGTQSDQAAKLINQLTGLNATALTPGREKAAKINSKSSNSKSKKKSSGGTLFPKG